MSVRTVHDLALEVRTRRRDQSLTQADLARRAGVSRQWVVALEGGKANIELEPAMRLLAALDACLAVIERPVLHGAIDLDDHLAGFVG